MLNQGFLNKFQKRDSNNGRSNLDAWLYAAAFASTNASGASDAAQRETDKKRYRTAFVARQVRHGAIRLLVSIQSDAVGLADTWHRVLHGGLGIASINQNHPHCFCDRCRSS